MFHIRNIQKTCRKNFVKETKIASDGLKSCAFEVSLADLQNVEVTF